MSGRLNTVISSNFVLLLGENFIFSKDKPMIFSAVEVCTKKGAKFRVLVRVKKNVEKLQSEYQKIPNSTLISKQNKLQKITYNTVSTKT
jgi:hypothetical protein